MTPALLVLDTNIVLDLLVFQDDATEGLRCALESGTQQWLTTTPMRNELLRVLAYPKIVPRLAYYQRSAAEVLTQFDRLARLREAAPLAGLRCADPDDQKFIDLAVACQAVLLSKDRAVLTMAKRLQRVGVRVQSRLGP